MRADGTQQRRLSRANVGESAWSPDGKTIVFLRQPPSYFLGFEDMYVVRADGSRMRLLVRHQGGDKLDAEGLGSPAWSPDGKKLDFESSTLPSRFEIHVINADGSRRRNLTGGWEQADLPAWSPDGNQIAFVGSPANYKPAKGIYVIGADGKHARLLTPTLPQVLSLAWSPDGKNLLFEQATNKGPKQDLYVINTDGSGLRNLTQNPRIEESSPAWSPTGKRIVYERGGDIYTIKPNGTGLRNVTRKLRASSPAWSPDGSRIAFTNTVIA